MTFHPFTNRSGITSIACIALAGLLLFSTRNGWGHELSGYVAGEGRLFVHSAIHPGQKEQSASLVAAPEYYHEWDNGHSFTLAPFYRLDSSDPERTHFDLREMTYLALFDDFEIRLGVRKVFWGTTESIHLVDIINQTDLVENPDTEDKLGQPMVNLSVPTDWGTFDLFYLPYFRERTFPGRRGRIRGARTVDTDRPRFESAAENWHTDYAFRFSSVIDDWDVGVYHFAGTGRTPTLLRANDDGGTPILIPLYEQIHQTGIDLSYVTGSWLWKFEGIHRTGQAEDFGSTAAGFEYTFFGIAETRMDLGILSEWLYDSRGRDARQFENDLFLGTRLTFNDVDGTEFLMGLIQDLDDPSRSFFIETSRRIGNHWKVSLEVRALWDQSVDDFLYELRRDDFAQLDLEYYF